MNIIDIHNALTSLPIAGVSGPISTQGDMIINSTWHQTADGWYRIDWTVLPSVTQTTQAQAILDANTGLGAYKIQKIQTIDAKTNQLIANGFTYNTVQYSLSDSSRQDWVAMYTIAMAGGLTYPEVTIGLNNTFGSLTSLADVQAFFQAGTLRYKQLLQDGAALKIKVNAAINQAGVDAVIDGRT